MDDWFTPKRGWRHRHFIPVACEVLNTCNKLEDKYFAEAGAAILAPFEGTENHEWYSELVAGRVLTYDGAWASYISECDTANPDVKARMKAFGVIAAASWNNWDEAEIKKRLEIVYENEKVAVSDPQSLERLTKALPSAFARQRKEINEQPPESDMDIDELLDILKDTIGSDAAPQGMDMFLSSASDEGHVKRAKKSKAGKSKKKKGR